VFSPDIFPLSFPSILVDEQVKTLPSNTHSSPMDVVKWPVSVFTGLAVFLLANMPMII
jgi:hypothetical protein